MVKTVSFKVSRLLKRVLFFGEVEGSANGEERLALPRLVSR